MNNFIGIKRIGQNKKAMELSEYKNIIKNGTTLKTVQLKKKLTTREALMEMSEFYEFDKKKTEFFIRQLELSGKI